MEECFKIINQKICLLQDNYISGNTYFRFDIGSEFKEQDKYLEVRIDIEEGDKVVSKIQESVTNTYDNCMINNFAILEVYMT